MSKADKKNVVGMVLIGMEPLLCSKGVCVVIIPDLFDFCLQSVNPFHCVPNNLVLN